MRQFGWPRRTSRRVLYSPALLLVSRPLCRCRVPET
jgi:hypothetical protein